MIVNLYNNMRRYCILKTQLLIKINKEQAIVVDNTAAQNLFIDLQKELTQELRTKIS